MKSLKDTLFSKIFVIAMLLALTAQFVAPVAVSASEVGSGEQADFGQDFGIEYSEDGIIRGDAYGEDADQTSLWNRIFSEYKGIILGITGIGTLTFVVFFIINFINLGKSANNPNDRQRAQSGLLWTGIAAAGFGGVFIFVGFFMNLLR